MEHRTQSDLENANFKSTAQLFNTPDGYMFGWGTTAGNGVQGWAKGALFLDTDASADSNLLINEGTSTTASWQGVST